MNELERARRVLADGVDSPVRAFGAVGGGMLAVVTSVLFADDPEAAARGFMVQFKDKP